MMTVFPDGIWTPLVLCNLTPNNSDFSGRAIRKYKYIKDWYSLGLVYFHTLSQFLFSFFFPLIQLLFSFQLSFELVLKYHCSLVSQSSVTTESTVWLPVKLASSKTHIFSNNGQVLCHLFYFVS